MFEYSIKDKMATITKYNGEESEVIIPATTFREDYPVTAIGEWGFQPLL